MACSNNSDVFHSSNVDDKIIDSSVGNQVKDKKKHNTFVIGIKSLWKDVSNRIGWSYDYTYQNDNS